MSEGIPTRQTLHVDDLEQMAMSFEREGKTQAALELYRQALEREGSASPRGNRFKTKVAELDSHLKMAAMKKPAFWGWYALVGLVLVMGLTIAFLIWRSRPAEKGPDVSNTKGIPKAPTATRNDDPEPARVEEMVGRYYGFITRGAYNMADNYWTDAWKSEARSSEKIYGKLSPVTMKDDVKARRLTKDRFTVSITISVGNPPKAKQALLGVVRKGSDWQISDEKLYESQNPDDQKSPEAGAPSTQPQAPPSGSPQAN